MNDETFGLESIGQIHITVDDVPAAVAFYRDVLGMKLLFEVPAQGMAFFDCGGVRLYLGRPEVKADGEVLRSSPYIYYQVHGIAEAHRVLRSRGVEFMSEPHAVHRAEDHELWLTAFSDPAGNVVHLMSEEPLS